MKILNVKMLNVDQILFITNAMVLLDSGSFYLMISNQCHCSEPHNTFRKSHLDNHDMLILNNQIDANETLNSRNLLNTNYDEENVLMDHGQFANIDKIAKLARQRKAKAYKDSIPLLTDYMNNTPNLVHYNPIKTTSIKKGVMVVNYIAICYQSKEMRYMMETSMYYGFTTDVTFSINTMFNTCISLVYNKWIQRSVPILITFMAGETVQDYYAHFEYIAEFITLINTSTGLRCSYSTFIAKFRISFDWSMAQYLAFEHVWKTHGKEVYPEEYDVEDFHASARSCKFHFSQNGRKKFLIGYKAHNPGCTSEQIEEEYRKFKPLLTGIYCAKTALDLQHNKQQIETIYPYMTEWLSWYFQDGRQYLLNVTFVRECDRVSYNNICSTSNRCESYNS